MIEIELDGKKVEVAEGSMVMHAAEKAGTYIPHFCYHKKLSIAANCRMCLVDVEKAPKPMPACATPVTQGMVVRTNSDKAVAAQKGVMEFLLINHPLDCPICDQGGECDLQDQAMGYGVDTGRFAENKRAVEDKYIGVLIKTIMTRCIQCTRCVRFSTEVCGVPEMGLIGRGEDVEITTYLESALTSELQGNLADICPVGALTSKPYAFTARPWELGKTQSVDVMDAVGSAIRVDTRGREVMRILPRINENVNEEWISDKTRHVVDGLRAQRLDRPYVRENGRLRAASWAEAFAAIAAKMGPLHGNRIGAIAGDLAAVEDMFALKDLLTSFGSANFATQNGAAFDPKLGRASYIFNPTIAGIEQADALLIIGSNPRKEAAVLNARIRKRWRTGQLKVGVIGDKAPLTYDYEHLGAGPDTLADVAAGKHSFADVLKNAKNAIVLVGAGVAARHDGAAVLALAAKLALDAGAVRDDWNGFAVLHTAASEAGALDIGFVPGEGGLTAAQMTTFGTLDVLFLLGADEVKAPDGTFVVYVGTHGDRGAHRADVILPGSAYTEKAGLYVNTEGRVQIANRAAFPPGEAREDWAIFRALSETLGRKLPYDSLAQLRQAIFKAVPHLARIDEIAPGEAAGVKALAAVGGSPEKAPFRSPVEDFYLTNPIARASAVMAECSRLASTQLLTAAE
jgi:NADH-quinone oxidoreductase subunit G